MNDGVRRLRELVAHPAPGFQCRGAGKPAVKTHLARVAHLLGSPLWRDDVVAVKNLLGEFADPFVKLYTRHDGFVLYRDLLSDAAGVRVLPFREWRAAREDLDSWLDDIEDERDPDCIKQGIPFAEAPHSGNYFVLPIVGPSSGKVFFANHDGWYEGPFADSLDGFIQRVCSEPILLLNEALGCYARYSDGETDTQWIPSQYFQDVRGLA